MRRGGAGPGLAHWLAKVEGAYAEYAPEWLDLLCPGLSRQELAELESELAPWRLPESMRTLYLWHDGMEESCELLPGYRLLPFEEAIEEYQMAREVYSDIMEHGWNPLWFPFLALEGDYYCIELNDGEARTEDSPIYLTFNEDTDLYLYYGSLAVLARTVAESFAAGAFSVEGGYLEEDETRGAMIRRRLVPEGFPFVDEEAKSRHSKMATTAWPTHWQRAIGRREEDYAARGATSSIAKWLAAPEPGRLRGKVGNLLGGVGLYFDLVDDSGKVAVLCSLDTVGAREVQVGRRYEIEIVPNEAEEPTAFERMRGDRAQAVARRVVRLPGN